MNIFFPYKSTPYASHNSKKIPSYPVIILYAYCYSQYDISFFNKIGDKPDFTISQEEYEKIIKQKEYRQEFQELIDE